MQVVVDAVLAVRREGEPIDLHMVEIMQMTHRTDTDTRSADSQCNVRETDYHTRGH